jgi:hypothetical protein
MGTKRIEELATLSASGVDRSGAYPVVRGVLLCGNTSANRRRYRKEAFAGDRVKRYESRPVFLDHGDPRGPRKYGDKIATVENARLRSDGMPVGDLAVNPKHPLAEAFLWDAEHKPKSCGMSHVANCETVTGKDGWEEITEVVEVVSVDLVTDPATTKGLHEHKARTMTLKEFAESFARLPKATAAQNLAVKRLAEMEGMDAAPIDAPADDASPEEGIKDAFMTACMHLCKQAMDGEIDSKEFAKKIKKLVDSHGEINGGSDSAAPPADDTSDDSEPGDDMPKESRPAPWDVLRECQEAGYTPSAAELETLALQPDAAKRKAFVTEQKAKAADAKAEKPVSAARKPGVETKSEAKLPATSAEFAASIR